MPPIKNIANKFSQSNHAKDTEISYQIDELCILFELAKRGGILTESNGVMRRIGKFSLSGIKVIPMLMLFHKGQFKNPKHYCVNYVLNFWQVNFLVTFNRKYPTPFLR